MLTTADYIKKYPALAEVAVWHNGAFRRVATFRQAKRDSNTSVYVHTGPEETEHILSFHASGQLNQKITKNNEEIYIRKGRQCFPNMKTRIDLWSEDELQISSQEERKLLSTMIFLKTNQFEKFPVCKYKPEIIFTLEPDLVALGLSFFPMTMGSKKIPVPTCNMAFGYTDATLPPVYVLANYSDFLEFGLAKSRNFEDPAFDKLPHIAYSQVHNKGLFPVICHPNFEKPTGMIINILNQKYYPPSDLLKAYDSLPNRPGKVDFDTTTTGSDLD